MGIIRGLSAFGIDFDEGVMLNGEEKRGLWPLCPKAAALKCSKYFCKELVEKGLGVSLLLHRGGSWQTLAPRRRKADKVLPAPAASSALPPLTVQQVEEKIAAGQPYVVRLHSPGKPGGSSQARDAIRSQMKMDENMAISCFLKRDNRPTYHFALLSTIR